MATKQWRRIERTAAQALGASLICLSRSVITGDEEVAFDAEVQMISLTGVRIIDKHLTIDAQSDPPVWGWITYRETTDDEQRHESRRPERAGRLLLFRPGPLPDETVWL